mmetsp:Transcript_8223/g.27118  ORF Transcript_8223/g.27118 Transcript_8223/m.27118 type:complete len:537 (-) Transcript_8223:31-1641(-)
MSLEAQLRMRQNVDQMHSAFRDLSAWSSDIEARDNALRGIAPQADNAASAEAAEAAAAEAEAREIEEAKAELARLALEDERRSKAGGDAAAPASAAAAAAPTKGAAATRVGSGPTNFDKWQSYDAEGAVEALERRESEREALRQRVVSLENKRAREEAMRRRGESEARADAMRARGNAAFGSARYEDAVSDYTEALEANPRSAALYANRSLALLKLRAFDEAEEDATAALDLEPSCVKARLRRAAARTELGKVDEAIEDLEAALEVEPRNKAAREALGSCRALRASREAARRSKRRVALSVAEVERDLDNDGHPFVAAACDPPGHDGNAEAAGGEEAAGGAEAPHAAGEEAAGGGEGGGDAAAAAGMPSPAAAVAAAVAVAPAAQAAAQAKAPSKRPVCLASARSLGPPATSADIEVAWRSLRRHPPEWQQYVRGLSPSTVGSLLGRGMAPEIFSAMLAALSATAGTGAASAEHAYGVMQALSSASRFSILTMCLDKSDEWAVAAAFDALMAHAEAGDVGVGPAEVRALRSKFCSS